MGQQNTTAMATDAYGDNQAEQVELQTSCEDSDVLCGIPWQAGIFIKDVRSETETALSPFPETAQPEQAEETDDGTPSSWEECMVDENVIDFEKAKKYLKKKQWSKYKRVIITTAEFELAMSEDPIIDGPFGLEIQALPLGRKAKKVKENLRFSIKLALIEAGFPKSMERGMEKLLDTFTAKYDENLNKLRDGHIGVTIGAGKFSVREIVQHFFDVKQLKNDDAKLVRAKQLIAEAKLSAQASLDGERTGDEGFGAFDDRSPRIPITFLQPEEEERVARLLVLFDSLGAVKLDKANGERLLDVFKILQWSNAKAMEFLFNGEDVLEKLQRRYRRDDDPKGPDIASFLRENEFKSFYDLLLYAMERKHELEWRNQAVLIAFTKLKYIGVRLNKEFRHVEEAAALMHRVRMKTKKDVKNADDPFDRPLYERDGNDDPIWTYFTYYEDRHGNKSLKKDETYYIERSEKMRLYVSPLTGKRYGMLLFGKKYTKSKASTVLKGFLQNTSGDPDIIFDAQRNGQVMVPLDARNRMIPLDEVNKDEFLTEQMFFLYMLMKQVKFLDPRDQERDVKMKVKTDGVNLDDLDFWREVRNHPEYLHGIFGTRPAKGEYGQATIENIGFRGNRRNSDELFECTKIVFRMPEPIGTGCEEQVLDPENYCEANSPSSTAYHGVFVQKRSLDLHGNFYPGKFFPGTGLLEHALFAKLKADHLRYIAEKQRNRRDKFLRDVKENSEGKELPGFTKRALLYEYIRPYNEDISEWEQKAALLDAKAEIYFRLRSQVEAGQMEGGYGEVSQASNDDMYALAEINDKLRMLYQKEIEKHIA